MATRSTIALELNDGRVMQIYCHWDGYLDHNGKILVEHYTDYDKIEKLLSYGDLSVLDEEIGEKNDFENKTKGVCLYYGRDRGDKNVSAKYYESYQDYVDNANMEEYNYIFRNGEWYVKNNYSYRVPTKVTLALDANDE